MGRRFLALAFFVGAFLAVVSGAGGLDTTGCGKTKRCLLYSKDNKKNCSSTQDCYAILTVSKKKGGKVPVEMWAEKKERGDDSKVNMAIARHLGNGESGKFYAVVCDLIKGVAHRTKIGGPEPIIPFPGAKIDKGLRTCRFNLSLDWVQENDKTFTTASLNAFGNNNEEYVVGLHFVGDPRGEDAIDFIIVNFAAPNLESVSGEGKKTPKKTTEATKTEVTKTEVTKTEVTKTQATKTEVAKTEVTKTQATKTEVTKTEPTKGKTTTETSKATKTKGAVKSLASLFPLFLSLATLATLTTPFLC